MKPELVSVVTAHMVYFCAFARSEIFLKTARKSGVGCRQFDAGVNGLICLGCSVTMPVSRHTETSQLL